MGTFRLEGFEVRDLTPHVDDRGWFSELYRSDWTSIFRESVAQVNLSASFPGVVRAWHRHVRGQVDYFVVVQGVVKLCAWDPATGYLEEHVSSERRLQVVRVPGHYYHGVMAVGNALALVLYATSRLYDYQSPDEERLAWNDASVVPSAVNGNTGDPRVGVPWDWLRPPHR